MLNGTVENCAADRSARSGDVACKGAAMMIRYEHYIDGAHVRRRREQYLPTENPYTGKVWAEIARGNAQRCRRRGRGRAARVDAGRLAGADAPPSAAACCGGSAISSSPMRRGSPRSSSATTASSPPKWSRRSATWATTSSTTRASPTRCRAPSSRPTRRACSPTRATSRRASSRSSRRGTRR